MHVYRYQYKTRKKINIFVPGAVIGIAVFLLLAGEQKQLLVKLKREIQTVCYEKMMLLYLPDLVYDKGGMEKGTLAQLLLTHFFPLGSQNGRREDYPTQVESVLSYGTDSGKGSGR